MQLCSHVTSSDFSVGQQPTSGVEACPHQSHSRERMRSACSATSSTPGRPDGSVSKHRMTSCLHGRGPHGQGWHRCCGHAVRARTYRGSSIGRRGQNAQGRAAHTNINKGTVPQPPQQHRRLWHLLEAFRAAGRHIIWPAHAAAVTGPDEGRVRSMAGGGQNCILCGVKPGQRITCSTAPGPTAPSQPQRQMPQQLNRLT